MMITILHIISGDTIIGDVTNNIDIGSKYTIENPFSMVFVDDSENGSGVHMQHLLAYSQQTSVQIRKNSVVYTYTPSIKIEEYYKLLVDYSMKHDHDKFIQNTIDGMEEMDKTFKDLISQRFKRNSTIN